MFIYSCFYLSKLPAESFWRDCYLFCFCPLGTELRSLFHLRIEQEEKWVSRALKWIRASPHTLGEMDEEIAKVTVIFEVCTLLQRLFCSRQNPSSFPKTVYIKLANSNQHVLPCVSFPQNERTWFSVWRGMTHSEQMSLTWLHHYIPKYLICFTAIITEP